MMLRSYRSLLALSLLTAALLATGCGKSSSPTSPTTPLDQTGADDIAVQTPFALDQLGLDLNGAMSLSVPATPARLTPAPAHATWDTTVTVGNRTATVSLVYYDAQNQQLARYDTSAVRLVWTSYIYGSWTTDRDTAAVGHRALLDLRGIHLGDTTLTVNGTCLDTLLNKFRSYDGTRTRYFNWRSSLVGANVVMQNGVIGSLWPLSGTLTYVVNADRLRTYNRGDVETHLSATVVITFDGTDHPNVVINRTWHYQWDMQTGSMVRN